MWQHWVRKDNQIFFFLSTDYLLVSAEVVNLQSCRHKNDRSAFSFHAGYMAKNAKPAQINICLAEKKNMELILLGAT